MKYLVLMVFLISIASNAQGLNEIRSQYPTAVQSAETTAKLDGEFAKVTSSSKPVLIAYKGAVLTLKAKFAKKKTDKKDFFKEGVSLIENAIKAEPENIEIRYTRMSVQENSPRFLGYHKNIDEDKQFIFTHYNTISSLELKKLIKDFILKSESFDAAEREKL